METKHLQRTIQTCFLGSIFFLTVILFLPIVNAQDYTQLQLPEGAKSRIGKGDINDIKFSPDGNLVAVAGSIGVWLYNSHSSYGSVRLWDVEIGQHKALLKAQTGRATAITFSPDGRILANGGQELPLTSNNYMIELWETDTGENLTTLEGHTSEIEALAFSSDGATLISASWDRTIRLWDVNTGDQLSTFIGNSEWLTAVSFSPDEKTLVSGGRRGELRLWYANTGEHIRTLSTHHQEIMDVVFSLDGSTFMSASRNGTIQSWDARGEQFHEITLKGHTDGITAMALSPNGRTLASGTYGRRRASGSWEAPIRLWNIDTQRSETVLKVHTSQVNALAFSPNGKIFASASDDKTIRLWHVNTERSPFVIDFQPQAILREHTDEVLALAFSPDGGTLASGGREDPISFVGYEHEPTSRAADWAYTFCFCRCVLTRRYTSCQWRWKRYNAFVGCRHRTTARGARST